MEGKKQMSDMGGRGEVEGDIGGEEKWREICVGRWRMEGDM